jgi:hypothetical protein
MSMFIANCLFFLHLTVSTPCYPGNHLPAHELHGLDIGVKSTIILHLE